MQIININDTLYADILANIFTWVADSKSISQVCKQWYNIICDHPLIRSTIPSGDLTCAQVSLMPAIHYNSLTKKTTNRYTQCIIGRPHAHVSRDI